MQASLGDLINIECQTPSYAAAVRAGAIDVVIKQAAAIAYRLQQALLLLIILPHLR